MSRSLRTRVANLERRAFGGRGYGVVALILDTIADLSDAERQAELLRWGHLTLEQLIWMSYEDGIVVIEVPTQPKETTWPRH